MSYQATHSYYTLLRSKENSRNQGTNHPHNKPRPDMNTDNMSPLKHSNADKEGLETYNITEAQNKDLKIVIMVMTNVL